MLCAAGGVFVLLGVGAVSPAKAQAAANRSEGKAGKAGKEPPPDPMAEIEKLRLEFEQRLQDQVSAANLKQESLRKEQAAALERVRAQAEKQQSEEAAKREQEILRLRQALEEAAAREDLREKNAAPSVGATQAGVSLYGYVQADGQVRQSSEDQVGATTGQPLNEDRFMIRRARLGLSLDRTYGAGRLEIDGNTVSGPSLRLFDAEASVKLPGRGDGAPALVMGTIGMFRIPFGQETPQDDRQRLFMERSTASRAFFPGETDIGAKVSGGWHSIRYQVAVQNGEPLGTSSFPGLDPNHQKDVMGRVGVESAIREKVDVVAGVSVLRGTGFHQGNLASKPTVQWNDTNEDGTLSSSELSGVPGSAAGSSSSYTRFGFGADLLLVGRLLRHGESKVNAEFYLGNDLDRGVYPADPKGVLGRSLRELGYSVAVSQRLHSFELGARYDYYNPDRDSNKFNRGSSVPSDVSYSTVALAAAVVSSWGRFIVELDRNRNHLGINAAGMPSNLSNNAVLVRGEARF
jgi:ElaB/YqjD/DUF883 family membrane-anchored ribosome-binding protein